MSDTAYAGYVLLLQLSSCCRTFGTSVPRTESFHRKAQVLSFVLPLVPISRQHCEL